MLIRALAGVLIAGCLSPALADTPLTLQDAVRLASARSRAPAAQDAAVAAANAMAVAAAQLPDPTLKLGVNNLPIEGEERFSWSRDFMTMRSVGVAQELTRAAKRTARARRYQREGEVARAERDMVLADLQRATALAWLERHYQDRMRALLGQIRDEARLQVEAAQAAYRGGRGARADMLSAQVSVAQWEDRMAELDRDIAQSSLQLQRWVGEVDVRRLGAPPAMDAIAWQGVPAHSQIARHPRIASALKQEDLAQAEVQMARSNLQPDWSVELMYSQRGSLYSNMVSLNVSVPLQWDRAKRQDRDLAAKLASVERLRAQREEIQREHLYEIQAMTAQWQAERERLVRYDSTLVPLAQERTASALTAYRGGAGTLQSVLEGRREELNLRLERLRVEMSAARLWAQLRYLEPEIR